MSTLAIICSHVSGAIYYQKYAALQSVAMWMWAWQSKCFFIFEFFYSIFDMSIKCDTTVCAPVALYVCIYHEQLRDLTLPIQSPLSSKAQGHKIFCKPSKPCHVGINWIALVAYFQMSTHISGFRSFFRFFASFCIGQISQQQHKG